MMKLKRVLPGVAVAVLGMSPLAALAQEDWSTSTTEAINASAGTVIGQFFTVLPYILGGVAAVVLTMWGIKWIFSLFRRK